MSATRAGGLSATSNHGRYPGAADPSLGAPEPPLVVELGGVTLVERDPDWTFRELHDLEKLLACVPGGSLTRLIDSRRFEARILVGVGPFKILYTGAGRIVSSNPRLRTASIALTGRSTVNLPPVRIRMSMTVREHPRGSEIRMAFHLEITDAGRLVGAGLIDSIARDMLDRTINRIKRWLEAPPHLDPAA